MRMIRTSGRFRWQMLAQRKGMLITMALNFVHLSESLWIAVFLGTLFLANYLYRLSFPVWSGFWEPSYVNQVTSCIGSREQLF